MGFFRKKEYTLSEALKKINEDKRNRYTTVPIGNGKYLIEKIESVQKRIDAQKPRIPNHKEQEEFKNIINGNGTYQNMPGIFTADKDYNDYSSSRGYQRSSGEVYR